MGVSERRPSEWGGAPRGEDGVARRLLDDASGMSGRCISFLLSGDGLGSYCCAELDVTAC